MQEFWNSVILLVLKFLYNFEKTPAALKLIARTSKLDTRFAVELQAARNLSVAHSRSGSTDQQEDSNSINDLPDCQLCPLFFAV